MENQQGRDPSVASDGLQDRNALLREINLARQDSPQEREVFLLVVNIADTKRYDEIIRVFGFKLADTLLETRLADLEFFRRRRTLCRVGFWSVGLIFKPRNDDDDDTEVAGLIRELNKPVLCRGIPVRIKAGVGICDLAKATAAAEDLLQATYLAGQAGAASLAGWAECVYDDEIDHRRAFTLISDAMNSLATPYEFSLRYQARVDLKTGQAGAVEAFLRWRHPVLGTVMPDEFIPLIEMTGLIRELTIWVLTHAIAQTSSWHALGHRVKICVKISVQNLFEEDFSSRLSTLFEQYKLGPEFLEIEISERRQFIDMAVAQKVLTELRALGVTVSVDDFGTGESGFAMLEHLPVNAIKIDRRLVLSLRDNFRQQSLVRSIIGMAHELGMYAVAEGVENDATLKLLTAWGCDYAEGFLINRPMPAEAFMEWFASRFKF